MCILFQHRLRASGKEQHQGNPIVLEMNDVRGRVDLAPLAAIIHEGIVLHLTPHTSHLTPHTSHLTSHTRIQVNLCSIKTSSFTRV